MAVRTKDGPRVSNVPSPRYSVSTFVWVRVRGRVSVSDKRQG